MKAETMKTLRQHTHALCVGLCLSFSLASLASAAPSVSLSAPAANTVFAAPGTVTLTANASPSSGWANLQKVDFYQGTTLIGSDTTAPYSVTWSNVPAGSYSLTAKATDTLGAVATSSPVSITVNASAVTVYYLHTDHLNTPRLVTDEQNKVLWRRLPLAEPFGMTPPEEDPDGNGIPFAMNLRFPGQYADKESNLNYNYYRDYNPSTGRYIESDPIGLQGGINTYGYVEGSPLTLIDPSGLSGRAPGNGAYADGEGPGQGAGDFLANMLNALDALMDVCKIPAMPMTIGIGSIKSAPKILGPYVRPSGATTIAQRAFVQGKACVKCGALTERQIAGHKDALVKEYYRNGAIDKQRMRSIDAIQPECPTCSAQEGADMSRFSRDMKKEHGF